MAIITISRGTFSGGKDLAECVADKLGYRLLSREVLAEAAMEFGVPLEKLTHALGDKPGILDRMKLERAHYLAYIQAALCREVKDDAIVYHGHAGHLLLRGVPHVLRVRVIGNTENRIQTAMERKKLDRKKAIEVIRKRDEDRARWTRFLYHVDWLDPSLYDLVINLDHTSPDTACEIVSRAAGMPAFKFDEEAQKIMRDLALAAEIRARVAAQGRGTDGNIKIDVADGIVNIFGVVPSLEASDLIKKIARDTPAVRDINSQLKIRNYW